jgi:ureidoacrylate peracid hydrolase
MAEIVLKSEQPVSINPANAVFVAVDVENEFCKPGGARYTDVSARIMPVFIPTMKALLEKVRAAKIPIIYIHSVRTLKEAQFTVFGRDKLLELGSWGAAIIDEIEPQRGDIVIDKFTHDCFFKTALDQTLERLVPDPTSCQAVITGGAIHVCAYHAAMGFHLRNYWTVVVMDCCYAGLGSAKGFAVSQFSLGAYPNIFLTRSDLIEVSSVAVPGRPKLVPGT